MRAARTFLLSVTLLLTACATAGEPRSEVDPWESMNRRIFAFNETVDKYFMKPVAQGYHDIMPDIAERGITNFIDNVYELNSLANGLLQAKFSGAAYSGGRFVVNTTLGLLGLIDVATPMGLTRHQMDFGQTLAVWGFGSGPYVVLPFFGPKTVRSGFGYFVDSYYSLPGWSNDREAAWGFWAVEAVNTRALLLDAEKLISGDRYIFLRDAYLQRREAFVTGKPVQDTFSDFGESDEDWEEF